MRYQAIRNVHTNVVTIHNELTAWDNDGNIVNLDETKIQEEILKLQKEAEDNQYQRDRADSYPDLKEQLDLLWHAIDDGKFNVKSKETDFYKKLKSVKDANPKPE